MIAKQSLQNRKAITLQRFAISMRLLYDRPAIAVQSLSYGFAVA
jgi:hypothetical protein